MHPALIPALITVPIVGALFGPRLWAAAQLRRHDAEDDAYLPADELARRLLDRHGLTLVRVEATDLGDHYDPLAAAVRLNRARFHRRSLTAATTAAHEVGHALQDASGYWAFRLHHALARVARVATGAGTVLLLTVPAAALVARTPAPTRILSFAAMGMLGTGLGAQLAALPAELDASFSRALPLLRDCCLSEEQAEDARRILLACSLTYLASAAAPALMLGPWLGRVPVARLVAPLGQPLPGRVAAQDDRFDAAGVRRSDDVVLDPLSSRSKAPGAATTGRPVWRAASTPPRSCSTPRRATGSHWLRRLARPAVRAWLRATGDY